MTKTYPTLAEQAQAKTQHPRGYYLFLNKIKRKKQDKKRDAALREIKKLAAQANVDLREVM